jgi:hypothetical protein
MAAKPKFYMVYLAADDSIVAVGSAQECVEQMGLSSVDSFYAIVSKVRHGKRPKYEVIVTEGDEDE